MNQYEFEKKRLYGLLGENLVHVLKSYDCFIAGGTITSLFCNREINDFDIYFRSKKDFVYFLRDTWDSDWIVSSTNKATTIILEDLKVQAINFRFFENANEIFDTFDFTVCMGALDLKSEEFILHPEFLKHNAQRILKFNSNTAFPIISLIRVGKYKDKGYSISKTELIKIVLSCMELNINSYEELKEHLGGMYGINYDKMFEGLDDKDFNLKDAIEYISSLTYDDNQFESPVNETFKSFEDLIRKKFDDYKTKYFKLPLGSDFSYFVISIDGEIEHSYDKPKNGEEIDAKEYFKDRKLYKYVKKKDDRYFSFFDEKFEYKIGEEVTPKGKFLYFTSARGLRHSSYSHRSGRCCLEVDFNIEDLVITSHLTDVIKLKKCFVIREVPESEIDEKIEKEEEFLVNLYDF